jgi:hypothetical protein
VADFTADFEAGSNGATITTAGGEASATAFTGVVGAPTYSNTHVAHGLLAAKCRHDQDDYVNWAGSDVTESYGRFYVYCTGVPDGYVAIHKTYDGGSPMVEIFLGTGDNKIIIRDSTTASVTSTNALATGGWARIEYHIVHSATVGQATVRIYNTPDSSTATEELSSPASWNTGTKGNSYTFGHIETFSGGGSDIDRWFDDLVANATTWPGPATTPAQHLAPSADSADGKWTNETGGTSLAASIDESTASDSDWIRSELSPQSSPSRVKLTAGSDPLSSSSHTIRWRIRKDATGGDQINMTVTLYQGGGNTLGAGTQIATFSRTDVSGTGWTTYDETLSTGEADAISDYSDLYLEFSADIP